VVVREHRNEAGGVTLEALLEFLLVLILLPPLITCAIQGILGLANIVLPWVAFVVIVFIVATALTVMVTARPRRPDLLDHPHDGELPLLPPIDRPKVPKRRDEDDVR
jgi:hypothetical protein